MLFRVHGNSQWKHRGHVEFYMSFGDGHGMTWCLTECGDRGEEGSEIALRIYASGI